MRRSDRCQGEYLKVCRPKATDHVSGVETTDERQRMLLCRRTRHSPLEQVSICSCSGMDPRTMLCLRNVSLLRVSVPTPGDLRNYVDPLALRFLCDTLC
jgi:hypothetical protein